MNTKFNDLLGDIIHLASGAMLAEDEQIKRQAMADIVDGIASVMPVEKVSHGGTETRRIDDLKTALAKIEARLRVFNTSNLYPEQAKWLDETRQIALAATGRACRPATAAEPQGLAKFLTVAPGVTLVRFAGKDEIRLIARRVGSNGNPNTIFGIDVNKRLRTAVVFRDDRELFTISGDTVNYSMVEACAVSALRRWFKKQRKNNSRRRRAAGKLREGILTPEQELARTVAEQMKS